MNPAHMMSCPTSALRPDPVPDGPAAFLIDLENLLGDPFDCGGVAEAMAYCLYAGDWRPDDDLVVAGHFSLLLTARRITSIPFRPLPAWGRDGADRALVEACPAVLLADRHHRVVIASGDHFFADLALELKRLGVEVWVVARPGSTAFTLRRAADRFVPLGLPGGPPTRPGDLRPPRGSQRHPLDGHRRPPGNAPLAARRPGQKPHGSPGSGEKLSGPLVRLLE